MGNALESIHFNNRSVKKTYENTVFRKFEKIRSGEKSDIPCGIETYTILNLIHEKDQMFHVPLLPMIIFNCGLEGVVQVLSFPKLIFRPIHDLSAIKKSICSMAKDFPLDIKSDVPLFILKFKVTKRLEYNLRDFLESLPDTQTNCVIQKYIRPKGLKAIKHRVVLDSYKKVIIFSNKIRIDAKNDDFQQRDQSKSLQKLSGLEKSVAMHKEISKEIKNTKEWKSYSKIRNIPDEKVLVFNYFHRGSEGNQKFSRKKVNIKASTRFLTHADEEKTSLYEGKNQSFAEIIQITEYLKEKIDNYYLDGTRLIELAVDYLQDSNGMWHLLKIKYGKVERKNREIRRPRMVDNVRKKKIILRPVYNLAIDYNNM